MSNSRRVGVEVGGGDSNLGGVPGLRQAVTRTHPVGPRTSQFWAMSHSPFPFPLPPPFSPPPPSLLYNLLCLLNEGCCAAVRGKDDRASPGFASRTDRQKIAVASNRWEKEAKGPGCAPQGATPVPMNFETRGQTPSHPSLSGALNHQEAEENACLLASDWAGGCLRGPGQDPYVLTGLKR